MTTTNETGQRRAKVGGEYGANGEWYEGGKFIATVDRPKQAPMRHELTPEEIAIREQRMKAEAARFEKWNAWLSARRAQFAEVINALLQNHNPEITPERWQWLIENGHGGFHASLGKQLNEYGSLSWKQVRYVLSFWFGRRNKKNADDYDALEIALVEKFNCE